MEELLMIDISAQRMINQLRVLKRYLEEIKRRGFR